MACRWQTSQGYRAHLNEGLVINIKMDKTDSKIRILVVDGSSVSRKILTRILVEEFADIEVVSCESGKESKNLLGAQSFDLITTALLLPDMDGLALCRFVRDSRHHHYTPVIVVSGDADQRLLREGFKAGVTDYFDKSEGYKAFGSFIKSFIQRNSHLVGNILFVEDSKTAAAVTVKILENHGLKVTQTASAEEAITLLHAQFQSLESIQRYDLVITDFYLSGNMTGGDLLHAIRARFHYSQQELPVLVLTGNNEQQTQVEVYHAGANDYVSKPILEEVLMARVRLLLLLRHQYEALKEQAETMRWVAATDSLTGVRSKRYLVDNGEAYIRDAQHQPIWAMIIDIDHFKSINDRFGHITGDHVLAEIGDTLNRYFPGDMVVRFGGEEFCILMKNRSPEQALSLAENLRKHMLSLKPAEVDVTISAGLASTDDHPGCNLTQLVALADKALYYSKNTGRNRVALTTKEGVIDSPWAA